MTAKFQKEEREKMLKRIGNNTTPWIDPDIVKNYTYMNWIEDYTEIYGSFQTDVQPYYDEEKDDTLVISNIERLDAFFEGIMAYANQNYIDYSTAEDDFGSQIYYIAYHGSIYEIGLVVGQGAYNYCKRLNMEDAKGKTVIKFSNIVDNIPHPGADEKTKRLAQLADEIEELIIDGIPEYIVRKCVNIAILRSH